MGRSLAPRSCLLFESSSGFTKSFGASFEPRERLSFHCFDFWLFRPYLSGSELLLRFRRFWTSGIGERERSAFERLFRLPFSSGERVEPLFRLPLSSRDLLRLLFRLPTISGDWDRLLLLLPLSAPLPIGERERDRPSVLLRRPPLPSGDRRDFSPLDFPLWVCRPVLSGSGDGDRLPPRRRLLSDKISFGGDIDLERLTRRLLARPRPRDRLLPDEPEVDEPELKLLLDEEPEFDDLLRLDERRRRSREE